MNYREELQKHYEKCIAEVKHTQRATKDIVGKSYENLRTSWIKENGLDVATTQEKLYYNQILGNKYNADQYIVDPKTRNLLAFEEDKGHYIDKCFAKRAIINAVEIINHCLKNNIKVPYFILSCPTNFKFDDLLNEMGDIFREELYLLVKSKVKFFHSCDHGRTSRKKYLREKRMPFVVEPKNINIEKEFFAFLGGC
tara:strand:- start:1286 stop:1876 length:591 start_codon:yes stop_codon:yes gene_type:complete